MAIVVAQRKIAKPFVFFYKVKRGLLFTEPYTKGSRYNLL